MGAPALHFDVIVIDADLSDAGCGLAIEQAVQSHLAGRPLVISDEMQSTEPAFIAS